MDAGTTPHGPGTRSSVLCRLCLHPNDPEASACGACGRPLPAGFAVLEPLEHPVLVASEPPEVPARERPVVCPRTKLRVWGTSFVLGVLAATCFTAAFLDFPAVLRAIFGLLGVGFTLALLRGLQ